MAAARLARSAAPKPHFLRPVARQSVAPPPPLPFRPAAGHPASAAVRAPSRRPGALAGQARRHAATRVLTTPPTPDPIRTRRTVAHATILETAPGRPSLPPAPCRPKPASAAPCRCPGTSPGCAPLAFATRAAPPPLEQSVPHRALRTGPPPPASRDPLCRPQGCTCHVQPIPGPPTCPAAPHQRPRPAKLARPAPSPQAAPSLTALPTPTKAAQMAPNCGPCRVNSALSPRRSPQGTIFATIGEFAPKSPYPNPIGATTRAHHSTCSCTGFPRRRVLQPPPSAWRRGLPPFPNTSAADRRPHGPRAPAPLCP